MASNKHLHIPDLRSYAFHKRAAQILLENPERINEVYDVLNNWLTLEGTQAQGWANEWLKLIEGKTVVEVANLIVQQDEKMDFFRKSSPFAALLTDEQRQEIIHMYRYKHE